MADQDSEIKQNPQGDASFEIPLKKSQENPTVKQRLEQDAEERRHKTPHSCEVTHALADTRRAEAVRKRAEQGIAEQEKVLDVIGKKILHDW